MNTHYLIIKKINLHSLNIIVQENVSDIIKLYVRYGADFSLITKQFQMIVQQKISTKFINDFCFQLNKKTYKIIVEYLKIHKDQKGQKQIQYNDLWPQKIDDLKLRAQILDIPTSIFKKANKDTSQAYNLLMESLTDSTLIKLIRYQRIRDLYQFISEIILSRKKDKKDKKEKHNSKENIKAVTDNVIMNKVSVNSKKIQKVQTFPQKNSEDWTSKQQRYLCLVYVQKSLFKCCEKLKQKFGESVKWNTTKKVYLKAEKLFQRALKKALKTHKLKQLFQQLKITRQALANQIIERRSIQIQRKILKYERSINRIKKSKCLNEALIEINNTFKKKQSQQQIKVKKETIEEALQNIQNSLTSQGTQSTKVQIKIEVPIVQEEKIN